MDIQFDTKQIGKIIAFLASTPPNSRLRLILQLALTFSVSLEKYKQLLLPIQEDKQLSFLLQKDNLLVNLMNTDGDLEDINLETINMVAEKFITDLAIEFQELETCGTLKGVPLFWSEKESENFYDSNIIFKNLSKDWHGISFLHIAADLA